MQKENNHITVPEIAIPDCFVDRLLKLNNGKNGHGEGRLYTGNSHINNEYICKKPLKIEYPLNYKEDIKEFLEDKSNFTKVDEKRKEKVFKAIDECSNQMIQIVSQNGNEDVRRYYIGPNKEDKENKKLFDTFRMTLIPKQYSIKLTEYDDYFLCKIIKNDLIEKTKKNSKSSNASMEYLNFIASEYDIEIQNENNGGEFQLRNPKNGYFWPVDGYHNCKIHQCKGTEDVPCPYHNHIWEFQGDYFHGNPNKYNSTDMFHNTSYFKKQQKDLDKQTFYQENGYIVNIKWESDWIKDKKIMKQQGKNWLIQLLKKI